MQLIKELINQNPKAVRKVAKFNPYVVAEERNSPDTFGVATEYQLEVKIGVSFLVDYELSELSLGGFSRYKEQACKSVQQMVYGELVDDLRDILSKVYSLDCLDLDSERLREDAVLKLTNLINKIVE